MYNKTSLGIKDNFLMYLQTDKVLSHKQAGPALMKVNTKMDLVQIFSRSTKNYILLLRTVFTKRPLQGIAIFYKPSRQCFYAYVWNVGNGCSAKQKIKMKDAMFKVPHIKLML